LAGPDPDHAEPEFRFFQFAIPADAGRRVWLARFLLSLLDPFDEVLMQIGDWGVWPLAQHMPLFRRFRQAFGEVRPLIEVPGQIFAPTEKEDAESILIICVLFLWNCYVLPDRGDVALFVSHDEYGWVAARKIDRLNTITEALRQAGV
jgi:hypothetical protein